MKLLEILRNSITMLVRRSVGKLDYLGIPNSFLLRRAKFAPSQIDVTVDRDCGFSRKTSQ